MSTSIEERVVQMKFDNAQFERGVSTTRSSLQRLKQALSFSNFKDGFRGIGNAAKSISLEGINRGAETLRNRFSILGTVATGALLSIGSQALHTGQTLIKSLTLDPIMDGFREYETQLNSVQTILANTAHNGTTLDQVNAALNELNTYADKTIYNFTEMTRNIGTFTAAGVDLDTSTNAIKGIANLAAVSGSNSQQASTAMYQLSQALAAGKVSLMDWNSVVNAGMGGKVFQDALIRTSKAMGTGADEAIKKYGSFRESLTKGEWLTTDVLTQTLGQFAGKYSAKDLKGMGYSDKDINDILKMAKTAEAAATEVKTFTQLLDTLKEAVGSGWAQTWQMIFGDFEEAKTMFTGVSNALGGIIDGMSKKRNDLIKGWKDLGGRDDLLSGLGNAFKSVMSIVGVFTQAMREIFPPITAQQLKNLTQGFENLTKKLTPSGKTLDLLKRTFKGFFAILSIGWQVIAAVGKAIFGLLDPLLGVGGGVLEVTASIGDFLVGIDAAIKKGDFFGKAFSKVGSVLKVVFEGIGAGLTILGRFAQALGKFVVDLFRGKASLEGFKGVFEGLSKRFSGFAKVLKAIGNAAKETWYFLEEVFNILFKGDFVGVSFMMEDHPIVGWLFNIRDAFKQFFKDFDFNTLLDALNVGALAALALGFRKALKGFDGIMEGGLMQFIFGKGGDPITKDEGILDKIKGIFGTLTNSLKELTTSIKVGQLLMIAGAIAALTASVVALSLINSGDLTKSITALSFMMGGMLGMMELMGKITDNHNLSGIVRASSSFILVGIALNIMAGAVKKLSALNPEQLAKGLIGVGASLGAMAGFAKLMQGNTKGLISSSFAMILVGSALKILASAAKDIGKLDWETLGKAGASIGGLMGLTIAFGRLGGSLSGILKGSIALGIIGLALNVILPVFKGMAKMGWEEIAKGAVGLAATVGSIALGMSVMSGSILGAASFAIAAGALWILMPVLKDLGNMEWEAIGKAATMLAGSLLIIAGGMYLMSGIILGAASMLVAVAALWVLVPLLVTLGDMNWESIGKAATMLAAALLIIAGGLYLMTGTLLGSAALIVAANAFAILTPVLLAMSVLPWDGLLKALAALAGTLTVLGVAGVLIIPALPGLFGLGAAIGLIGAGAALAGAGVFLFASGFTALAAAVTAGATPLVGFLRDLAGLIPHVAQQMALGITSFLQTLAANAPTMVQAVVDIVKAILKGMRDLGPDLINTVTVLINSLLTAIRQSAPNFIQTMIVVISGLMTAIDRTSPSIINTLVRLTHRLLDAIQRNMPSFMNKGVNIVVSMINGITRGLPRILSAATTLIITFLRGISAQAPRLTNAAANTIITFVNSMANTIRNKTGEMQAAGRNLAGAIIDGLSGGLLSKASKVTSSLMNVAQNAYSSFKSYFGIHSPSRVFKSMGVYMDQGLILGLQSKSREVANATVGVGKSALDGLRSAMSGVDDILAMDDFSGPVITPVLDLSEVEKSAGDIRGMMPTDDIDVGVNRSQASDISNDAEDRSDAAEESSGNSGTTFTLNQYNNSPKSLSNIEIYRQTKNQLSKFARGFNDDYGYSG